MLRSVHSACRIALIAGTLAAALARLPSPAAADDTLTVTGSANPTAFFEVLMSVARHGGLFTAEHLNVVEHYTAGDMKEYGSGGAAGVGALLVANGKGDVATTTLEPVLQGYEKGLRLQSFSPARDCARATSRIRRSGTAMRRSRR
jgi:hypothetical protein